MTKLRKFAAIAALSATLAATPAHASRCWDETSANALAMRNLDVMLMVTALRCELTGVDLVSDYNRFVSSNRAILVQANQQIQDHFAADTGRATALNQYDRLMVRLANSFGNGNEGMDCSAAGQVLDRVAQRHNADDLGELADEIVGMPASAGRRCSANLAVRR